MGDRGTGVVVFQSNFFQRHTGHTHQLFKAEESAMTSSMIPMIVYIV